MIDIHCHILPGIDDGAADINAACKMAKIAATDGITDIIATPHIKDPAFSYRDFVDRIKQLRLRLKEERIPVNIHFGGEIYYLHHHSPDILKQFSINQNKYVLLEFPHTHLPSIADKVIFDTIVNGFIPIIAHPERNASIIKKPRRILQLQKSGALIQITAASLTGYFGHNVKTFSEYLLKKKNVHFIASDAHSVHQRPPVLSKAFKHTAKLIGKKAANTIFTKNALAVLKGISLAD